MDAKVLKSFHIGPITLSETFAYDTVILKIGDTETKITEAEFKALVGLSYSVSFYKEPEEEQ